MQPFHTLKSVWLSNSEVEPAVRGKPLTEQLVLIRTLLQRMIQNAVLVDVTAPKHTDFMAFWDKSQKRGYTAQRQKEK